MHVLRSRIRLTSTRSVSAKTVYPSQLPGLRLYSKLHDSTEVTDDEDKPQPVSTGPKSIREALAIAREEANRKVEEKMREREQQALKRENASEKTNKSKEEKVKERENKRTSNDEAGPWKKAFEALKPQNDISAKEYFRYFQRDLLSLTLCAFFICACLQISREKTKADDKEAELKAVIFTLEDAEKEATNTRKKRWEEKKQELLDGLTEEKKLAVDAFVTQLFNITESSEPSETSEKPTRFF
eukprot:TRINITY_DN10477_c0_g1_i1.p1 TRINITY_DN10477_c0_g1~~TRINITY_DN10477_c0_g1_i1.p1  ORF type:complete len:243 (-),score=73.62 TRINITY_DN10477_c0_g1_i1:42-770(-)